MTLSTITLRLKSMRITKIKSTAVATSIFFGVLLSPLSTLAITVEEVPNPRSTYGGWVSDTADILSDSTEAELNKMISELEAKNGAEIAVVTVAETSPSASPKAFTTELFNYWGIGKKDVNNGVLYLISVGDRRVEIETGYGLTKILPDEKVKNIIDNKIIPNYKEGNFDNGTVKGTQAIISSFITRRTSSTEISINKSELIFIALFLGIPFSFLVIYLALTCSGIKFDHSISCDKSSNSSSRFGSSSSNSSGNGFGGGSSGGSGAGGSF